MPCHGGSLQPMGRRLLRLQRASFCKVETMAAQVRTCGQCCAAATAEWNLFEAPRSRKEALPAPWTFGNPLQRTRCDSRPAPVRSPHPPHQLFAFVFSASKLRAWLGVWTNRIQNGGTKALPRTAMRGPARHETNARDLRRSTPGQLPSERTQDDSTGVHD